jgi:prepilin-type N-terminal cleavage/methylation domain-containing protein
MVTRGFTLVEVIVSLTLVGICALGITAATILAGHTLGAAHARAGAALLLASIADSLLLEPVPEPGTRVEGRYRVSWTVVPVPGGSRIELSASYHDGRGSRSVPLVLLHAPPPRRIGGRP